MGVEALAVTALTAATVFEGAQSYNASQSAASAQKSLANEQRSRLTNEANEAAALAAREATTGQTFGFDETETAGRAMTGFGFGAASSPSANTGRGQITGMG